MSEEWRDIPNFEGRYQVSDQGRVKSLPRKVSNHTGELFVSEKILKARKDQKGYMRIDLTDNNGKKRKNLSTKSDIKPVLIASIR